MLTTIITTLFSLFVGGAITWAVSRWYYHKASADLVREAAQLREQSNLMLRALREFSVTGNVEYNSDPKTGEPKGIDIRRTTTSSLGVGDDARPQVPRDEPEKPPKESDN